MKGWDGDLMEIDGEDNNKDDDNNGDDGDDSDNNNDDNGDGDGDTDNGKKTGSWKEKPRGGSRPDDAGPNNGPESLSSICLASKPGAFFFSFVELLPHYALTLQSEDILRTL